MKLDDIKDPKLRQRIVEAMEQIAWEGLKTPPIPLPEKKRIRDYESKDSRKLQSPQPQPTVCHEPVAAGKGEKKGSFRIAVRITAFRSRLLDTDNLCPKALVDGLRYSGLIPDDRPQDIELTVAQEKCRKGEERTEIELILP